MSRDVKHGSRNRGGRSGNGSSRGSTLVGIFIGMVLGILIALAVVWYMNRTPSPFVERAPGANGPTAELKPGAPGVANAPASGEKRFQFYEILPGKAEPKPNAAPAAADKAPARAAADGAGEPAKPAELFLQAGSFQNAKDADNLKASLALMGQEASVQQVMLADKVWYRVRLGPFAKPDEAGKVKTELARSGIEASLVRGRD